jgi:hypothetical protein
MIICIYEPNASGFQCPLPLMHRALTRVAATVESPEIPQRGAATPDLFSAIKAKIKRDGHFATKGRRHAEATWQARVAMSMT